MKSSLYKAKRSFHKKRIAIVRTRWYNMTGRGKQHGFRKGTVYYGGEIGKPVRKD